MDEGNMHTLFKSIRILLHTVIYAGFAFGLFMVSPPATAQSNAAYTYDELGRLKRVDYSGAEYAIEYTYDEAGNRTELVVSGASLAPAPDDDTPPSFSIDDVSGIEGDTLVFTITKIGGGAASVLYTTTPDTASAADYQPVSGALDFSASETSQTVSIATFSDTLSETSETFYLDLSDATEGAAITDTRGVATLNDASVTPPGFQVTYSTVFEGEDLVFTVTKVGTTSLTHSVNYTTLPYIAEPDDYEPKSGTLTFAPSETTKTIRVRTFQDEVFEATDRIKLGLSDPTGGAILIEAIAIGSIRSDDPKPIISVSDASVTEGGNLIFTVTRNGATDRNHRVDYTTVNGSALTSDYTPVSGTLLIRPSEASQTVTVQTVQDNTPENHETLTLSLSNVTGSGVLGQDIATGTILNNDVNVSVGDSVTTEGGDLLFAITKTGIGALTVSFATGSGGTAGTGDYTPVSGSVPFSANETTQIVSVLTQDDALTEEDETVLFNLTGVSSSNGNIIDGQATGTITDNDQPLPVELVRNASGALQAPYTETFIELGISLDPLTLEIVLDGDSGFYFTYDGNGSLVHSSENSHCDTSVGTLSPGYRFTGNGCELIRNN